MRSGFIGKIVVVAALVALFDHLFDGASGATVGGFAAAWLAGLLLVRRDVRRTRAAWVAAAAAGLFAVSLFDDPGLLAGLMFWCALSIAALLPRTAGFDDAWRWAARLALHGVTGIGRLFSDLLRLLRLRRGRCRDARATAAMLALPVVGGMLFATLFAAANPMIEQALAAIRLPYPAQIVLWLFVACCVWPSLRPSAITLRLARELPDPDPVLPGTSLPSVLVALGVFNAIFAVQNGLDVAFLWSGGALPAGMTQTEYVHRGAYPLIATALIAGVLALAMLRPGSAAARHPLARRLVTLWVAQNLVLVASSMLRTIDYIATSMLTAWRIAALLWMLLVALGLVLIGWRILTGRSAAWLINRNALAAVAVLTGCSFVDLGERAAAWNVARQAPGAVDLCYLEQVGDGALLPLIALERRPMDAVTRDRVRHVRQMILTDLAARQGDWRRWTPRGARRLRAARARLGAQPPLPRAGGRDEWRSCGGALERSEPRA